MIDDDNQLISFNMFQIYSVFIVGLIMHNSYHLLDAH